MGPDHRGFPVPVVDEISCVSCGLCEKVCPVLNRDEIIARPTRYAVAVRSTDPDILQRSTSGGIAYELARTVIEMGGIVFAACYGKDFHVAHRALKTVDELRRMQGSKYVQSDAGGSFKAVKRALSESGSPVLFIGTPCQVAGVKCFLRRDYDNLFLLELICHGVPSPALWKKFLTERKFLDAENIYFRYKDAGTGWSSGAVFRVAREPYEVKEPFNRNHFTTLFAGNYGLRDSCFDCCFKRQERFSDLTCGDLWGIEEMLPDVQDDRGMSLLLINSEKGEALFSRTTGRTRKYEVDYDTALKNNLMLVRSVQPPADADEFWKLFDNYSVRRLARRFVKRDPVLLRIRKFLYPYKQKFMKLLKR